MSTEYDAFKKAEDDAKKQYDKDRDDALNQDDPEKRKEAAEAAQRKYRKALEDAWKAYLEALTKAKTALIDFVNKQIENKGGGKEVNTKPIPNMVALVMEAHSLEVYKPADDCKKDKTGPCMQTPSKDQKTINCEQGNCKCKCHAYVSLGGQLLRAEGLIHGAHFTSCPATVNDTFGSGTIQCKCVDK